ncbi:hypothetical protein [Bdellovibrio sp. HCB2-146]|uniref:hypothetical protein n=1 Tax=Bdellovibrio sp. HCB2-146 TaxID=3394362 RepID=UPI0039BD5984
MKFIYVLEDDIRAQKEIFESLQSIDSKLQIRFFQNLAEFHEFLKTALTEGPKALAVHGHRHSLDQGDPVEPTVADELRLVIAKDEFLGTQNMGLIRRARDFFVRKQMCSIEEPTALIITAFDSPDFDIKLAEERIINNVIFKPFDKLILKQDIEYALTGHHPLQSSSDIATMKISSTIEMLKEVPFESVSEVGFKTINNHEIRIGSTSKYYDKLFQTEHKRGIFATCISCKEVSEKEFHCEFAFLGADPAQIQQIRKHVLQNKAHKTIPFNNSQKAQFNIIIFDEDAGVVSDIKSLLEEKFSHIHVDGYSHSAQLLSDLDDKDTTHRRELPNHVDLFIASMDLFLDDGPKKWEQFTKVFADRCKKRGTAEKIPDLALYTKKRQSAEQIRDLLKWAKEIFYTPWDRLYFVKKLLLQWPALTPQNDTTYAELCEGGTLKVANPVQITQISEAGIILKYYRAIGVGSFREFILWRPDEVDTPEIIGTCNYAEKEQAGEAFLNHFVFFGMKDHYLKHIRIWLREAYIKQKEK